MINKGTKTHELLWSLSRRPLEHDECNDIAKNRLPFLVQRGLVSWVATLSEGNFYAVTPKGKAVLHDG